MLLEAKIPRKLKQMEEGELNQHGYYSSLTNHFPSPCSKGGEGLHNFHERKSLIFNCMIKTAIALIRILSRLGRFYDYEY